MSVSKLPIKVINLLVETEYDSYTYGNVRDYRLPVSMTDTPLLSITKKDGNQVAFNWLQVVSVEEVTSEELAKLEEESEYDNDE